MIIMFTLYEFDIEEIEDPTNTKYYGCYGLLYIHLAVNFYIVIIWNT